MGTGGTFSNGAFDGRKRLREQRPATPGLDTAFEHSVRCCGALVHNPDQSTRDRISEPNGPGWTLRPVVNELFISFRGCLYVLPPKSGNKIHSGFLRVVRVATRRVEYQRVRNNDVTYNTLDLFYALPNSLGL